jgi:hypothetical protein
LKLSAKFETIDYKAKAKAKAEGACVLTFAKVPVNKKT